MKLRIRIPPRLRPYVDMLGVGLWAVAHQQTCDYPKDVGPAREHHPMHITLTEHTYKLLQAAMEAHPEKKTGTVILAALHHVETKGLEEKQEETAA